MSKKKKTVIISTASLALVIIFLTVFLSLRFTVFDYGKFRPYSAAQREIIKMRTAAVSFGGEDETAKRTIDSSNPLNLVTYYDGAENIQGLWTAIPESVREFSVLLLIPGNILKPGNDGAIKNLKDMAAECERLGIPFAIQNVNGETHAEWLLPLKYLEEEYLSMRYCYGLSAAELYNAPVWRGLDGDLSDYVADSIRLASKHGGFMFWTDTNQFGKNGNIVDWLENNEYLYSVMKAKSSRIMMQNKESYGNPSTYSLMYGLYLAGLIGGWGVSTDF